MQAAFLVRHRSQAPALPLRSASAREHWVPSFVHLSHDLILSHFAFAFLQTEQAGAELLRLVGVPSAAAVFFLLATRPEITPGLRVMAGVSTVVVAGSSLGAITLSTLMVRLKSRG